MATGNPKGQPLFANSYDDQNPERGSKLLQDQVYRYAVFCSVVSAYADLSAQEGLNVYPNPTINRLTVTTPDASASAAVTIYTVTGRKCAYTAATTGLTAIDMSNLPGGTYLVEYNNGKGDEIYQDHEGFTIELLPE